MGIMGLFKKEVKESKIAGSIVINSVDSLNITLVHEALKNPIIRTNLTYLANFLDVDYTSNKQVVNNYIKKFKINSNEIIFNLLAYGFCIMQVVDKEVKVIPHYKISAFSSSEFVFDYKTYKIDNKEFFIIHLGYYPSLQYSVLYPIIELQNFKYQGQLYKFNILSLYNALIYASAVDLLKHTNQKTIIEVNEITNELLEQIRDLRLEDNFILGQNIAKVTTNNTNISSNIDLLNHISDLLNLVTYGSFAKLIISDELTKSSSQVKYQLLDDFVSHYKAVIKEKIKEILLKLLEINGIIKDFELIELQDEQMDWIELYKLGVISKEELRTIMRIDEKIPKVV